MLSNLNAPGPHTTANAAAALLSMMNEHIGYCQRTTARASLIYGWGNRAAGARTAMGGQVRANIGGSCVRGRVGMLKPARRAHTAWRRRSSLQMVGLLSQGPTNGGAAKSRRHAQHGAS